jgi:hypothetical protein
MKTYNCKNPEENPIPGLLKYGSAAEASRHEPVKMRKRIR